MGRLRWGIIGFGEAGSAFAKHIGQISKLPVLVTDPLLNRDPIPEYVRKRLQGIKIEVVSDIPRLVKATEVVFSLVRPSVAHEVAVAAGKVRSGAVFIDFNSISPREKRRNSRSFSPGTFLDGAILGSIAGEGAMTRLAVSGTSAHRGAKLLRSVGLRVGVMGAQIGAASALKMCRSIFMKGLECLLVETLLAAEEFKITEPVLKSVEQTFDSYGLLPMVRMLVTTHALHCCRRADEMRSVKLMMDGIGVPVRMCEATQRFLSENCRLGLPEHFRGAVPQSITSVIKYLKASYR